MKKQSEINYLSMVPFLLVHVACLAAIWTGFGWRELALCAGLYVVRMFAVTAGYHRYFSHRTYKTSRVFQFLLGVAAQLSAQRGILWWAAKHREHHKYSDTPQDVHSPRQRGFWYSHVGWIFARQNDRPTDLAAIPDLSRFPELVWLDKNLYLPAILLGFGVWFFMGWPGLVVGFLWSTVILYHSTFTINSLAHVVGRPRYVTGDDSRNNWWLAILTLGEGWHNNHHFYQSSTRQGFRPFEIDLCYYALKFLSFFGLVWDLRQPPASVVRAEGKLPGFIVEKAAWQVAQSYPLDVLAGKVKAALSAGSPTELWKDRVLKKRAEFEAALRVALQNIVPSLEQMKHRAREMFAHTPSLDDIVARARQMLVAAAENHIAVESWEA